MSWSVLLNGYAAIIARTSIIYLCLLVGFRLTGKRQMGQMTLFDFVVVILVSNAVQNGMLGPDTSLSGALVSAATLFGLNYVMNVLRARSRLVARWVGGVPTTLIDAGRFCSAAMDREHVTEDEVMMALREHGIDDVAQVNRAILELDGTISVLPMGGARPKRRVRVLRHH